MTRRKIEKLLEKLADSYELPLTKQQRDFHFRESQRSTGITIAQCWEHEQKLEIDDCYNAIDTLLRAVPKDKVL